jgi:Fe-S cluster biosynthesis and repair protein YggX
MSKSYKYIIRKIEKEAWTQLDSKYKLLLNDAKNADEHVYIELAERREAIKKFTEGLNAD